MENVKIDNRLKLIDRPHKIKIDDKNFIKITQYEKRNTRFFDIIFNNCGKEIFVGRYFNFNNMNAMYKDGKILVFSNECYEKDNKYYITMVHTLYDILDDTHYSLSEAEALELFDSNLDSSKLKNKERLMIRCDVEKRHRFVK